MRHNYGTSQIKVKNKRFKYKLRLVKFSINGGYNKMSKEKQTDYRLEGFLNEYGKKLENIGWLLTTSIEKEENNIEYLYAFLGEIEKDRYIINPQPGDFSPVIPLERPEDILPDVYEGLEVKIEYLAGLCGDC